MIKRLRTTLLVAMAILMVSPCAAQSDGGGKKKKKPVKTEQTTNTQRKQDATKRQQKAEAKRKQEATRSPKTTGSVNGHEWVDLGLSVKWATCNVGASSPSDYGNYYAWGETSPKSTYTWSNCFDCLDDSGDSWDIYKLGGKTRITPTSGHDTARENWGGAWRMPTEAEIDELNNKCEWAWTTRNGHAGYLVTGPNGNSIFLPAAGARNGGFAFSVDDHGNYWSSTLSSSYSDIARYLYFFDGNHYTNNSYRSCGLSVRPVIE